MVWKQKEYMNILREGRSVKIDFEGIFDRQDEEELEHFVVQELYISKMIFLSTACHRYGIILTGMNIFCRWGVVIS